MPQLHLYVPEEIAAKVEARARARSQSVSRFLAELVQRELSDGWPEHFFDTIIGGWKGDSLQRSPQGEPEERTDWP